MEVLSTSSFDKNTKNGEFYYEYNDKSIEIDRFINHKNKNKDEISYIFKSEETLPVKHIVDPLKEINMYTTWYFKHIKEKKDVPMFHKCKDNRAEISFNLSNDKVMEFTMEFTHEVYSLILGDKVFVFNDKIDDPYYFKDHICNEVHFIDNNKIFVMDHEQREFYVVDSHYQTILSGRCDKKFRPIDFYDYRGDKTFYTYRYNETNGKIMYVTKNGGPYGCYKRMDTRNDYYTESYFLPYAITSNGIFIGNEKEKIYKHYEYNHDCENISETIAFYKSEELDKEFKLAADNENL